MGRKGRGEEISIHGLKLVAPPMIGDLLIYPSITSSDTSLVLFFVPKGPIR